MKHKHEWQFVKEFIVDEVSRVLWRENYQNGKYAKFICHCGAVKVIRQIERER